jgi:putative flippase GtrA
MTPGYSEIPILIPAYEPGQSLVTVVHELLACGAATVIVVDDGSGPAAQEFFQEIAGFAGVHLVRHAVNLGKGAALKTGLNFALVHFPDCVGVVTADADGQHHWDDIVQVGKALEAHPGSLIMGARSFGQGVPLRSKLGNGVTVMLMRLIVGQGLADTQTGLRGVPRTLIPHLLRMPSSGYEFELDMLIACKHQSCPIVEQPIRTIYLDNNQSSHFRPVWDSMRIYFLLFRFSILSLFTAVLDNTIFYTVYSSTGSIAQSQIIARCAATILNYSGARQVVFQSQQRHLIVLPKFVLLVACNGVLSYGMIQFLHHNLGMAAFSAKLLAEGILFIANFAIQRDFVFTRRQPGQTETDWERYYKNVPGTAKLMRRYTTSVLLDAIRHFSPPENGRLSIVEIGGANSCFLDRILSEIDPNSYDVVDTNQYGLSLLSDRYPSGDVVHLHQQSVLAMSLAVPADLVFSIGLIEHFDPVTTRKAVLAHFDAIRPEGITIIAFPTPTLLYRMTRKLIEFAGMWKFPDERPLMPEEVISAIKERGDILCQKTLWPLLLTQYLVVAQKHR